MITIYQMADETSRSPDRPCYYAATAEWRGQNFTARARYGVINDLARQLTAAGAEDHFVEVRTAGIPGYAAYRSLHMLATRTVSEVPTTPLRDTRWIDPAPRLAALATTGVSKAVLSTCLGSDASSQPPTAIPPQMETTP